MFSLKPGVAYYALSIAISIVVSLMMVILFAMLGGSALKGVSSEDPRTALTQVWQRSGLVILFVVGGTVVTTFLVANWLMPPLCRWISRSRSAGKAMAATQQQ